MHQIQLLFPRNPGPCVAAVTWARSPPISLRRMGLSWYCTLPALTTPPSQARGLPCQYHVTCHHGAVRVVSSPPLWAMR